MSIEQKAKNISAIRKKIAEVEKQFEDIVLPMKMERDAMQSEIIGEMKKVGTTSFKTLDKTVGISISERNSLQIVDESKVIRHLAGKKLKDMYKVQLVKPLFKGYASKAIKDHFEVPGTEIRTTEFISVRNLKGDKK